MDNKNRIVLIGDVHGKLDQYLATVNPLAVPSIQLGDMGLGDAFLAPPAGIDPPPLEAHAFLRGNHDSPALCRRHPNYLGDYGVHDPTGIFWISGAVSVDRQRRLASGSWWPDEELSDEQWERLLSDYERARPAFVISHECPASVNSIMLDSIEPKPVDGYDRAAYIRNKRLCRESRTCARMQEMLRIHRPRRWAFGHYHVNWEADVEGTRFFCLAELQAREFEV